METADLLHKCKRILSQHYRQQFQGLVLHGSTARGEAVESSDIDLLVLLQEPFDYFNELRQIIDLLYPVQLEADKLISAKPVSDREYELGSLHLYRSAKREGVLVK